MRGQQTLRTQRVPRSRLGWGFTFVHFYVAHPGEEAVRAWKRIGRLKPAPPLRDVRAARPHEHRVQRLAGGHVQPVPLGAAEAEVGADLRQQDHADALALRREDVYPVVARAAVGARPDIAVHVGADPVRAARLAAELHVRELPAARQLVPNHVEDLYVARRAGIHDIQLLIVGRKTYAVGLVERVRHDLDARRLRVHAVDRLLDFLARWKAFVAAHDAVGRVGEPDAAIGMHHDIVRRIQRLAVVLVGDHGHRAVMLVAHHAAPGVLAGELAAFEIEGVPVAVARRAAEHADVIADKYN